MHVDISIREGAFAGNVKADGRILLNAGGDSVALSTDAVTCRKQIETLSGGSAEARTTLQAIVATAKRLRDAVHPAVVAKKR